MQRHARIIIDIGLQQMMGMINFGTILQTGHALLVALVELQFQTQQKEKAFFNNGSTVDAKLNNNVVKINKLLKSTILIQELLI